MAAYWDAFLADVAREWRALPLDVRTLDERDRRRKLEALRLYVTKYAFLNGGPLRRLERPEILGFEVLLELL